MAPQLLNIWGWKHGRLLFDAKFLDSEFGSNRYRVGAFERGTRLEVVASALSLQLREEAMQFGIECGREW